MTPFAASTQWWCRHLSDPAAEPALCDRRALARALIAGDRLLSVPVEGGAASLKRRAVSPERIPLSDHGRWRDEHLGAWRAAYGRTPYFPHLYTRLEEAYNGSAGATLAEFNSALAAIVTDFLAIPDILPALEAFKTENPSRYVALRGETLRKVNLNYSIFDPLFRLGKNTLFIL